MTGTSRLFHFSSLFDDDDQLFFFPTMQQRRFLRTTPLVVTLVAAAMVFGALLMVFDTPNVRVQPLRRQLAILDPKTVTAKPAMQSPTDLSSILMDEVTMSSRNKHMPYKLPPWAETWCMAPKLPPLPYDNCDTKGILNVIPLYGGLTNALKMILLGAILSYEDDRCFMVEEQNTHLLKRTDPRQQFPSLVQRYFEPMGLLRNSSIVQQAVRDKRTYTLNPRQDIFDDMYTRRPYGQVTTLPRLHYQELEGHFLKKVMMRRLWRPLPHVRDQTCRRLAEYGLEEEYMAFSVRRGDKESIEHRTLATAQDYIRLAHQAIAEKFDGRVPKIFVASDDCTVMDEFRQLRPHWTFLSECDHQSKDEHGFTLNDLSEWTKEQTDEHFAKFFVELYGLAISKVFIGWSFTNVRRLAAAHVFTVCLSNPRVVSSSSC